MSKIYVLELEDNCWYVGRSDNVLERLRNHFRGNGSKWTKAHKPVRVALILPGYEQAEFLLTCDMVKLFGIEFVRGAYWSSVEFKATSKSFKKTMSGHDFFFFHQSATPEGVRLSGLRAGALRTLRLPPSGASPFVI